MESSGDEGRMSEDFSCHFVEFFSAKTGNLDLKGQREKRRGSLLGFLTGLALSIFKIALTEYSTLLFFLYVN